MKTKTIRKNKQGISLIVLVITIIVMVILAGAIILTLNNSGIIQKASEAVEETNLATVKEVASLAWAEAYADGVRTVEDLADGTKGFETRIKEAFEKNNIDVEKYNLTVTTNGVEVSKKDETNKDETDVETKAKWVKDGFTVVKGEKVLKIGELVDYDETAGGEKTGLTNVQWKVLGADDEGNLLIMSASDVKTGHILGDETEGNNLKEAQNDWINGVAELDGICEPYGYGEGVVGKARSITVEDVNKVTGYNPETALYGKEQLNQYKNEVTYKYNAIEGETKPEYTSAVTNGILSSEHTDGFYYYNEKTGEIDHITDLATGERGKEFAKVTSNYYDYYASNLTTISSTDNKEAFEMIFGEYDEDTYMYTNDYFLASNYVRTDFDCVGFGMRYVCYGGVYGYNLWYSSGFAHFVGQGVRAVVTLSSDIQFTEYTANGWSY